MVKIISDGRNKTFYTKCMNCATDFEYQLSDVETVAAGHSHVIGNRAVKCPSCGEFVDATLMTKEECDKILNHYPYGGYYGGCGIA